MTEATMMLPTPQKKTLLRVLVVRCAGLLSGISYVLGSHLRKRKVSSCFRASKNKDQQESVHGGYFGRCTQVVMQFHLNNKHGTLQQNGSRKNTACVTQQQCRNDCPGFITKDEQPVSSPGIKTVCVCGPFLRIRHILLRTAILKAKMKRLFNKISINLPKRSRCVLQAKEDHIECDFLYYFKILIPTLC